jgi:hypothetical protein
VRFRAVVVVALAACSFDPQGQPSDAARAGDARALDSATTPGADAAPLDAFVAPMIAAVQSLDPGYQEANEVDIAIDGSAGDILIAATYASQISSLTVSDSTQLTWTPLTTYTESATDCPALQTQFWYTVLAASVQTTVAVKQPDHMALGMHLVEYSGVSMTSPIDASVGMAAPSTSMTVTAPAITTAHSDAVVGLFADINGAGSMTAGSGWIKRGNDNNFYTLLVDNTPGAGAGTFTPTASLPTGVDDACWIGAAIALHAR